MFPWCHQFIYVSPCHCWISYADWRLCSVLSPCVAFPHITPMYTSWAPLFVRHLSNKIFSHILTEKTRQNKIIEQWNTAMKCWEPMEYWIKTSEKITNLQNIMSWFSNSTRIWFYLLHVLINASSLTYKTS